MAERRSVVVIDDHPLFRAGLATLIQASPDMQLVGEAASVRSALQLLRSLSSVDVVTVDLSLPDGHGLTLIPQIATLHENARIIVLSMYDELVFADRCLRAGAHGYVSKHDAPDTLLDAIRRSLGGRLAVGDRVVQLALERLAGGGTAPAGPVPLTAREEEVIDLLGQGLRTRAIAQSLKVSVKTVETHLARLRKKLGARNGAELARIAYGRRLGTGTSGPGIGSGS